MTIDKATRVRLEVIGSVMLRALIVGFGIMALWFIMSLFVKDMAVKLHSQFFDVTKEQLNVIWYELMGQLKLALLVVFFCPYVAIRWVLWQARTEA